MTLDACFTISELVSRTGVPASTVHHYRRCGLLPPTRRSGSNRYLFDERHVRAVQLVRLLRERRSVPLEVIRRVLPELLTLDEQEAFRSDMWEALVAADLEQRRRASPSQRLLSAAKRSFARRGYANVNVDELCDVAEVAKGSFYRYYPSKEDLFFAAAAATVDEIVERFDAEADRRSTMLTEPTAVQVLAPLLARQLPLLFDLIAEALRHKPGYPRVARAALDTLAVGVGRRLRTTGDAREAGALVVNQAVAAVTDDAIREQPLAHRPPPNEPEGGAVST